jgi:hypothetical protein
MRERLLIAGFLFLWGTFTFGGDEFDAKKVAIRESTNRIKSLTCPDPFLAGICATAKSLDPLFVENLTPVENELLDAYRQASKAGVAGKWNTTWIDSETLNSIPSGFCLSNKIDAAYCNDFRCFFSDSQKKKMSSCPIGPLPSVNTRKWFSDPDHPDRIQFDLICNGDFCFPGDRNKAEARRFMALDSGGLTSDIRGGKDVLEGMSSRYRCWVISQASLAMSTEFNLGPQNDSEGPLGDCTKALNVFTKIESALNLQLGGSKDLSTKINSPNAHSLDNATAVPAKSNIIKFPASTDSSSMVRGLEVRFDDDLVSDRSTHLGRLFLVLNTSRLPTAIGVSTSEQLAQVDLGISASMFVAADGRLSIPNDFAAAVLSVHAEKLAAAIKNLMPSSVSTVTVDSVHLGPNIVPLTFSVDVKFLSLGLDIQFANTTLDCSLPQCGLSGLTDGKILRKKIAEKIQQVNRFPEHGSTYLTDLKMCTNENDEICLTGTVTSPQLAQIVGKNESLSLEAYLQAGGKAALIPSFDVDAFVHRLSEVIVNRIQSLSPEFKSQWLDLRQPVATFRIDHLDRGSEATLKWNFSAKGAVLSGDKSVTFPVDFSDDSPLNTSAVIQSLGSDFAAQVVTYAKNSISDTAVKQLTELKDKTVSAFGQVLPLESVTCTATDCQFSLGNWISGVSAIAKSDRLEFCFTNATVEPGLRSWLNTVLPNGGGLEINIQHIAILRNDAICSSSLPKIAVDLTVAIPSFGIDPELATIELDPNTRASAVLIPELTSVLQKHFLTKIGSFNSLPFTIDEFPIGTNISLVGSFGVPPSAPIIKGKVAVQLYPNFQVTLKCPAGTLDSLSNLLKLPVPVTASFGGCSAFPVHIQTTVSLPLLSPVTFAVNLKADGSIDLAEPITIPIPVDPYPIPPYLAVRQPRFDLYFSDLGHFALKGSVTVASIPVIRMDATLDAHLSDHKLAIFGPLILANVPLADLSGSFDGNEIRGNAEFRIFKVNSTFLFRLSPLTYMQTMDVSVWNQLKLKTTFLIDTAGAGCGSSGLSACFVGNLDLLGFVQGNVVLYLRADGSDFASLKGSVSLGNIASLGVRASPRVVLVKVDAGIVKLSLLLPGFAELNPLTIIKLIGDALTKINIDPDAFLKGNWQISIGGEGHGGSSGLGRGGGGEEADGLGESPSSGNGPNGLDANARAGNDSPGKGDASSETKEGTNTDSSAKGDGDTKREIPYVTGPCSYQYDQDPSTHMFQRKMVCPGQQPVPDQACLWAANQLELLKGNVLIPTAIEVGTGQTFPDFGFTGLSCGHPLYRIFAKSHGGGCDQSVCVLLVGASPEQGAAQNLGTGPNLQAVLGTQEDPATSLIRNKPQVFTGQQWRALYVLATNAWDKSQRKVQSISCFMRVGEVCEMFLVTWSTGAEISYSLLSYFGEMSVSSDIAALQIKAARNVKYMGYGMVAVFETSAGQMVGWWSFEHSKPTVNIMTIANYKGRRSCWEKHGDAPSALQQPDITNDFDASDDWLTQSWKARSWRKNPLLLFVDSGCS